MLIIAIVVNLYDQILKHSLEIYCFQKIVCLSRVRIRAIPPIFLMVACIPNQSFSQLHSSWVFIIRVVHHSFRYSWNFAISAINFIRKQPRFIGAQSWQCFAVAHRMRIQDIVMFPIFYAIFI